MAVDQVISMISDIVVGISAAVAAIFATGGLNTWRKELVGKNEYELAKRMILALYQVKDAFSQIRSPFMSSAEYPEEIRDMIKKDKTITIVDKQLQKKATLFAYQQRMKSLYQAMTVLESEATEAQALWDSEFKSNLGDLRLCCFKLEDAISELYSEGNDPKDKTNITYEIIVYAGRRGDEFGKEVDKAIEKVELMIRPHLGKPVKKKKSSKGKAK